MDQPPRSTPRIRRSLGPYAGWGIVVAVSVLAILLFLDYRLDSFPGGGRYRNPQGQEEAVPHGDFTFTPAVTSVGQSVYVPAYSHVYHQDGRPYLLTITLSVRNTSDESGLLIQSVQYFDTDGSRIKSYLDKPLRLGPFASTEFLIERNDRSGGSGANFLVEWVADHPITPPVIEALMIDTSGRQGISFARPSAVLGELTPSEPGAAADEPE